MDLVTQGEGSQNVERLDQVDQAKTRAVSEFVDWCTRHIDILERGRMLGFEFAVSAAVKDAICLSTDRDVAERINCNLGDFKR